MERTRSIKTRVLASTLGLVATLSGCVLHWPDAPYLDAVGEIPQDLARRLDTSHPGARPVTPIYRRHVESRWGGYRIVSRWFLFEDARSTVHRAEVDESVRIVVHPARRIEALPDDLRQIFFTDEHSAAHGGGVSGPAWCFDDDRVGERIYEFEFRAHGRWGIGRIGESGRHMCADFLLSAGEHP